MASSKSKPPTLERPLNKQIQINVLQGQIDDYQDQIELCKRRAKMHIANRFYALHAQPSEDSWMDDAAHWQKRVDECQREIEVLNAIPGNWYGLQDLDAAVLYIVAISPGGHVVDTQKSDEGRKDLGFERRHANKGYEFKLIPEPEASRRHMRYIDSLRSYNKRGAVA
jgi:hypothetical protein